MIGCNDLLSAFDVERTATEALLFHTGYLTIRETKRRGGETDYRLGYPNRGWHFKQSALRTDPQDTTRPQGRHTSPPTFNGGRALKVSKVSAIRWGGRGSGV